MALNTNAIAIMDTGYLVTTTAEDSGETKATRANSGNAIVTKSTEVVFQGSGNIDNTPIINSNTNSTLNFGSISNAKLTISGMLDRKIDADMNLMAELNSLRKTLGIKLLYYTSATDGYRDITDSIGASDTTHNGTGKSLAASIPHLHIRVTNFTIRQTMQSNILRYTLEMEETA